MKFGGDCLSTPINQNIVAKIVSSYEGKKIVVCSAMGRDGFPYSTNSLIKLIDNDYVSNKEIDRLISCGEIISSIRLCSVFNSLKIKSYALSNREIGFCCDNNYGNSNVLSIDNSIIKMLLEKYDVLIVPGFIGKSIDDEIITLGRGNSDLTSVLIASSLSLKKVYLYKNVDGVFHTPPNVYKQFLKYDNLCFDEMIALNSIGFNIVSKKALEESKNNNIEIEVRNFLTNKKGTVINLNRSNDLILGFNIIDKVVIISSFYPSKVRNIVVEELVKKHIFIKNEVIKECEFSFEISKSIMNSVKKVILDLILEQNT